MDFLFIKLFEYFQAEGIAKFDLGMTPLANVGTTRKCFRIRKNCQFDLSIWRFTLQFEGLRNYKKNM
jgi:phosphatidylglycerol lysyltransferase